MKKNSALKISAPYKLLLISSFCSFFLLLSLISINPAYGIRLTNVKHLFDITHDFSQPSDVAVSKEGLIYVVDGVNSKIKVFNKNGKFIYSFGRRGSGKGEFRFPLGIDVDNTGKIYVADSGNHRVQIFNPGGSFISRIKIPSKDGYPSDPTDVAVNESENKFYVVDNGNHYILIYDLSTQRILKTFGAPGTEKREFRYPFLIALDKDLHLYIVDVVNTRVQVMNSDGLFAGMIGEWGVDKGQFFRPKGVAVDKNNRVYVSDGYMGVIQVFESNGEFYSAIGDPASGKVKKFKSPVGIFIDKNNRLYVVEMFADKVSVYSIEGDTE